MADDDLTRRQMLAAMLGAAPAAVDSTNDDFTRRQMIAASAAHAAAVDDEDQPDEDALPVPKEGPYVPLVNQPPNTGYSPPRGPPPWADTSNMLASALAGGAVPSAMTGPAGVPPSPPAPSAPPSGTHYAKLPGPPLLLPGAGDNGLPISGGAQGNPSENPLAAIGRMLGIGGTPAATPASAAAAASGGAQPIAGQASDLAPQTPEQQEIFRARQQLRSQEQALTAQIAGTSNIELAKALAAQRLQLSTHDQQLEQLYIGTLKAQNPLQTVTAGQYVFNPQSGKYEQPVPAEDNTQALTDEQKARVVAAGGNPDEFQSTSGKIEHIGMGNENDATIKEYNFYKQNLPAGQQAMSFNDFRLEKTGAAQRPDAIIGTNGQPIDESTVNGPAVLQAVPAPVGRMAQAMIEGRSPIPNLSIRTDPITRQAVLAAQAADPSLDVGNATARVKVRNEFLAGGPSSPAARMTAGNNAINHIDEANYYAQQLHDLGYDTINAAANAVTSGSSPVGIALKGYNTAVNNFAGEVVKFNTGSEGALEDRREKAALFSQNLTKGERQAAMESQLGILVSNMTSLQKRWRDGMGPLVPDFETIHPDSLASIERIKGNAPYPDSGGGLPPSLRPGGGLPEPRVAQVPSTPVQTPPSKRGIYVPGKGIQWQ